MKKLPICRETYEDALSWDDEHINREIDGICAYFRENWGAMSYSNQEILLMDLRALRAAQKQLHKERLAEAA